MFSDKMTKMKKKRRSNLEKRERKVVYCML